MLTCSETPFLNSSLSRVAVYNPAVIYLACPYSHSDPQIRYERFSLATLEAAKLMQAGYIVFSPVTHSYWIAKTGLVDGLDHDFWVRQDLVFMKVCDELHILMAEGWESSRGVQREIEQAYFEGIPIIYRRIANDSIAISS